jgi:GT2 family glycosyltransferase
VYYYHENPAYYEYSNSIYSTRDYSAVTAACMLMRLDVLDKIHGWDETLAVGYGDTDVCLRTLEAGYKVLCDSNAVLIHHESASRGKTQAGEDPHPEDSRIFRARYAAFLEDGDPYFHPLLSKVSLQYMVDPSAKAEKKAVMHTVKVRLPQTKDGKILTTQVRVAR